MNTSRAATLKFRPSSALPQRWWRLADRTGAAASFICAVHCALLPFVIALLPLVGLEFLADHRVERVFVVCAATLAVITLVRGMYRHGRRISLWLAAPAVMLLLAGVALDMDRQIVLHSILVSCGGVLLASAHVINLRLLHRSGA